MGMILKLISREVIPNTSGPQRFERRISLPIQAG
uniref:Uncharacterized protein n=1 Tax=Nelumbo nucifera TaxID=4432 RepID=A0A822ZSN0_NELNU|nr:TPA_asm: hypothetical protein HUJ06_017447 [Nelumbo nucifera]